MALLNVARIVLLCLINVILFQLCISEVGGNSEGVALFVHDDSLVPPQLGVGGGRLTVDPTEIKKTVHHNSGVVQEELSFEYFNDQTSAVQVKISVADELFEPDNSSEVVVHSQFPNWELEDLLEQVLRNRVTSVMRMLVVSGGDDLQFLSDDSNPHNIFFSGKTPNSVAEDDSLSRLRLRGGSLTAADIISVDCGKMIQSQLLFEDDSTTAVLVEMVDTVGLGDDEIRQTIRLCATKYLQMGAKVEPDSRVSLRWFDGDSDYVGREELADDEVLKFSAYDRPQDDRLMKLWGLCRAGAVQGFTQSRGEADGKRNSKVCVIDSGIDYTHPDLKDNMWVNEAELNGEPGVDDDGNGFVDDIHGYNFVDGNGDPMDDMFHGTHVAGTLGASGNHGIGITGVNVASKLVACKFLDQFGKGWVSDAIRCLDYCLAVGTSVSTNSWGLDDNSYQHSFAVALSRAQSKDHLFVVAAGDKGVDNDKKFHFPASYSHSNVLSVAAHDKYNSLASFSNYGKTTVDIAAPGVSIYSTHRNHDYSVMSGTSMAAAHVSGAASLLRSHRPDMSYSEIKAVLLASGNHSDTLNDVRSCSYLSVHEAVALVKADRSRIRVDMDKDEIFVGRNEKIYIPLKLYLLSKGTQS
eukprot:GHVQ01012150.1.p1 GENE.GHVQ01012150.1~~GHVQ01012150.1.p1  ORF type:complete len:636 (+),score=61.76 GHVQ01012150.1:49-1956(+)